MRIINIVDRLDRVNFGVWNAAIATAAHLRDEHGISSEIWFPEVTRQAREEELNGTHPRGLEELGLGSIAQMIQLAKLDPSQDRIVTHGCWQFPTRWGRAFKRRGFRWVAVPHGMLEQWSVSQKRLKKAIYFSLFEKPALRRADRIRAVGLPEHEHLCRSFGERTVWIPNGVPEVPGIVEKPEGLHFLFMARLHHKKGLLPLLQAWSTSALASHKEAHLTIAGPDDGAFAEMKAFLDQQTSVHTISYLGPVYGKEKHHLLERAHFYVLPSFSEGFPTSVLEAMAYGLLPIISRGCNFPDVLEKPIGIQAEPAVESISRALETALSLSKNERLKRVMASRQLIADHYTYGILAEKQARLYREL